MHTTIPSIAAIGQACAWLQVTPQTIRDVAEVLGIAPTMRINGVDHYAEVDLERIRAHLRGRPEADIYHR